MTRLLLPAATATLAAALAVALPACNRGADARGQGGRPAPATVPVTLQSVQRLAVTRAIDVYGTLHGEEETVVSAKVPGRIIALYKDIGDPVAPGEPLVQLKQRDYELAVDKAELAMKEVLAKLGLRELPAADFDVGVVPTVQKAKIQADNALEQYNRGKKLFEAQPTKLISDQDFANLETAHRVARAAYDVELLNARALVASAQALKGELDIAQQRLSDATTRAPATPEPSTHPAQKPASPFEFIVTARYVNVGELVREITPAYKLVDDNPIKLRAQVPEKYVADVKAGQKARIRIEAYPDVDFAGTISRVNPQIDLANRMFGIEILIPNDDHRLKPGAFARAAIETIVQKDVLFVPSSALVTFAGVNKVFTVKDGKAVEINVDPGTARTADEKVEIARGLKGDEQVVTTNAGKLAAGVPVTIGDSAPATTTPATTSAATAPSPTGSNPTSPSAASR